MSISGLHAEIDESGHRLKILTFEWSHTTQRSPQHRYRRTAYRFENRDKKDLERSVHWMDLAYFYDHVKSCTTHNLMIIQRAQIQVENPRWTKIKECHSGILAGSAMTHTVLWVLQRHIETDHRWAPKLDQHHGLFPKRPPVLFFRPGSPPFLP